ncbi:SHOCT domain-containing protein [Terasakiella sp. SH-1]|uniref:SHOCT domain-containing protein n=1 Tax=Terasakiella sp. SH-1 TaxID=2560057 RepID=UPI001073D4FF|nr:SHOCT domain-containing protein [Terasakiella sp. SH-1]
MFGKTKRYAALFAVGLTVSACGAIQEGSLLDPMFWERSAFSKTSGGLVAADKGLAELVKGNYLPAEALFDEALEADPRNVYALLGKAMIYQNTGQITRARSLYEAVLAQRPDESMNVVIWSDSTPRNVSEVASMNLSMIDSGSVVGNMATGAAGVDKPAQLGGQPGQGLAGGGGNYGYLAPSNATTAMRQTDMRMASGSIPEMGLDEGTRNIVSRFTTLRDLLDQGLITPEEYSVRRKRNVGALVPLTSQPPAAGLDRPVPTSAQVSGRLRAIGRALEMRAITIEQHAAERKMILDALMPDTPLVLANPAIPPKGLMASADTVRRLEGLKQEGLISSDEYARERATIEKGLQPEPPRSGALMAPRSGGSSNSLMPRKTSMGGPQPAVHLASYKSKRDASRGWTQLKRTHRSLLGGLSSEVSQVNLGPGKGVFYRLLAGPLDSKSEASNLCRKLKSKRQFCEPGFMGTGG